MNYFKNLKEELGIVLSLSDRFWFWFLIFGVLIFAMNSPYFLATLLGSLLSLLAILYPIAKRIRKKHPIKKSVPNKALWDRI